MSRNTNTLTGRTSAENLKTRQIADIHHKVIGANNRGDEMDNKDDISSWVKIVAFTGILACGTMLIGCTTAKKAERAARSLLAQELQLRSDGLKQKYHTVPCNEADIKWDVMIEGLQDWILRETK